MTGSSVARDFAATLVDEWVRAGVTDAVVSPGSRSTPLTLACAERLRVHVVVDERSAAFFALGYGKEAGHPAVLVSTSGTAAANHHPAVCEADLSGVPMLVCTADRPSELHHTGAPQAMDQTRLFGSAVRWFCDPGAPHDHPEAARFWRSLAARAVAEATGRRPGPVHLNLAFREPFTAAGPSSLAPGRPDGKPWTEAVVTRPLPDAATVDAFTALVAGAPRGLLLAGQDPGVDDAAVAEFAAATGWPVLADPLSGLRTAGTVTGYDAIVRVAGWAGSHPPDLVVRLGRPLTSKALGLWLGEDVTQVLLAPDAGWVDPHRRAALSFGADPSALLLAAASVARTDGAWTEAWRRAEAIVREAMDAALDEPATLTEPRIARDVMAAAPDGARLLLGSSMPVRDVESFSAGRDGVVVRSNRGVNGIDGMVSTALGMAVAGGSPVVALLGDLGFVHDTNGLLGATRRGIDVTFVVVDNNGGGIFSFLPQAGHPRFEELFATPHGIDLAALARLHGISVEAPTVPGDVAPSVVRAVGAGGVRLVHLRTDRHANVAAHRAVQAAVEAALG
jgi:2-succinyl-5-enolpyruvyl-6-hydroxy-3-cyclohexene-1-carboxylate synthase